MMLKLSCTSQCVRVCDRAGADLQENCSVSEVTFDDTEGLWTLTLDNNDKVFKARVSMLLPSVC